MSRLRVEVALLAEPISRLCVGNELKNSKIYYFIKTWFIKTIIFGFSFMWIYVPVWDKDKFLTIKSERSEEWF